MQPEWPADKVERRAVAALIPFQAALIVILTMRALFVMSLCTAMVAESAFAKQRFNPAYSACLHDAGPYCRKGSTLLVSRDIKAPAERFIATDNVRSGNYDGSGFDSSSKSGSWRNACRCSTSVIR